MSDTLEHDKQQRLRVAKALKQASKGQNGFGGNCAAVAYILDHVLQAEGDYVVVNGEHYEFADHVFLRWKDRLWEWHVHPRAGVSPVGERRPRRQRRFAGGLPRFRRQLRSSPGREQRCFRGWF